MGDVTEGDKQAVMTGSIRLREVGAVRPYDGGLPPFVVIDARGTVVESVAQYLRDLALSDMSPATGRSYGYDLLRWFRLLWTIDVPWNEATESEVALMVGWLRTANNPQRRRKSTSPRPGAINVRTGKQSLKEGYAPRTINHCLTVIWSFYAYHATFGRGPVVNPVPAAGNRKKVLTHLGPVDQPQPLERRARLRQRVPQRQPRSIPDRLWEELFDAMRNDRDRALLLFYVSSGARASELLAITIEDVDWGGLRIWVCTKGSRAREDIPADPQAFVFLARYLEWEGTPAAGKLVFHTLRGEPRPLSYWAMRRVLQRANDGLGTDWTLHDLRHTAAVRMVGDPGLTVTDVQRILRHANLSTLGIYTRVRIEDMFDRLQEHYARPVASPTFPSGYQSEDIATVFGG